MLSTGSLLVGYTLTSADRGTVKACVFIPRDVLCTIVNSSVNQDGSFRTFRQAEPFVAAFVHQCRIYLKTQPVFEKTCATSQKKVKSHVFWIFKKT